MTPAKSRTETLLTREAKRTSGSPALPLQESSAILMTWRVILWAALAAFPFFLKGMHAAAGFSSPLLVRGLGFLGLAATCLPVAMALLCLHELAKVNLPERVRRTVGREAVLGAVSEICPATGSVMTGDPDGLGDHCP